jgi:hypothetical protein
MYGNRSNQFWFRDEKTRDAVISQVGDNPDIGGYQKTWQIASALLHRNAAVENMCEYFYKWLELEMEFRGFRLRSAVGPKDSVEFVPRQGRHSDTVIQRSGYLEGALDLGQEPPIDEFPYLKQVVKACGSHHVIESSILWVALAQKPMRA